MEDNFYKDDFESFLKDNADSFRMYPSKKVWHSLYNDLHPSRKWPSFAVSILLISAILFIGINNNNSINNHNSKIFSNNFLSGSNNTVSSRADFVAAVPIVQKSESKIASNAQTQHKPLVAAITNTKEDNNFKNATVSLEKNQTGKTNISSINKNNIGTQISIENKIAENLTGAYSDKSEKLNSQQNTIVENSPYSSSMIASVAVNDNDADQKISQPKNSADAKNILLTDNNADLVNTANANKINTTATKNVFTVYDLATKAWVEDYAFHNKKPASSFKRNASFQFYITPSVGFRKLYKNNDLMPSASSPNVGVVVITAASNNLPLKDKINQSSAINIESGIALLLKTSKKFRFKTGLQFNYTGYNIEATPLTHPFQTNLLLNDPNSGRAYLSPRTSVYGNSPNDENKKKLKNNTLQVSLPIGLDYKIWGINKFKLYAGASIQPTYLTGGYLYALSADEKNYIEDPNLLRKWNLNASFETFLSYKTPSGLIISAGPQIRYQFLSTYDKKYTYTEKLYNLGIKLGMTTNF
jgi:hypothetical protein